MFDGDFTVAVMSVSGNTATLNTASSGRTAIVECEPNTTYTVKKHSVSNRFIIAESDIKPVNGTSMSIIQNNSSISEYTFTTSNTAQYVAIYCSTSSEQAEPQLMLNTGSTALPYEPYGVKIPILSASTTTPVYLGEVQTTRKIKKLVFTGEEHLWFYDSDYTRFGISILDMYVYNTRLSTVICSHYPCIDDGRAIGDVPNNTVYATKSTPNRFFVKTGNYTSITDFKTYLAQQYAAGTPVTVWYVLATPETAVVNEPLMKIGEYADSMSRAQTGIDIPTVIGQNTLDVLTTVKPSSMSIEYTSADENRSRSKRISLLKSPLKKGLIK